MNDFSNFYFNDVDLVIVGVLTGLGAYNYNKSKPIKQWVKSIKHKNIFLKNNVKCYL